MVAVGAFRKAVPSWRLLRRGALAVLVASSLADHFRAVNRRPDDWSAYDRHRFAFLAASSDDLIRVRDADGAELPVRLLGYVPPRYGSPPDIPSALDVLLAGSDVTLHLEPTQTRDDSDHLMAEAFQKDSIPIAASLVAEGMALADRRHAFAFSHVVSAAQSEARRKRVGIWQDSPRKTSRQPPSRTRAAH
jgi:hypothetical protein